MLKALSRSINKMGGGSNNDDEDVMDMTGHSAAGPKESGPRRFCLADFQLHETLGTGTFGRVRMVKHLRTGAFYALKISKKAAIIRMKQVEHVKNEISLLAQIDHPAVVNMLGHFQDEKKLYLVMEYVEGGELFSHLRSAVRFPDAQVSSCTAVLICSCSLHCARCFAEELTHTAGCCGSSISTASAARQRFVAGVSQQICWI
jgi:serine/threonine protein kinase